MAMELKAREWLPTILPLYGSRRKERTAKLSRRRLSFCLVD
jgi:hypothetical protein